LSRRVSRRLSREVNRSVSLEASRGFLSRALGVVALLAGASALLCAVWIVLPAPSHFFWLVAVGASEWGLFLAALGAFGVLCGLAARRGAAGGGRLWLPAAGAGCIAVVLGLYPLYSALEAARARGISLSLRQYVARPLAGLTGRASAGEAGAFTTYTYATIEGQALRLDAYVPPAGVESNGAAVVVVHGGSWSSGGRGDFPLWNAWLARQGFAVFDVDYRLAPQPNLAEATGDVKCAVTWVKGHAGEFRLSPDRVALLGRSAGGHLALLAAYAAEDDARLPPSCSPPDCDGEVYGSPILPDADVRAVVAFYAPTDLTWAYDNPANGRVLDGPAALRRFIGASPHESEAARTLYLLASPAAHVTHTTPATLLVHGGQDQLVRAENMEMLAARLDRAGVPHREVFLAYAQHGFDYNFDGWGAQVVRPVLLDFLRENTQPR
jgi:acetyl esterase